MKRIKLVLLGDGYVGKTAFIRQLYKQPIEYPLTPAIFENYLIPATVDGTDYLLDIWDSAGQEEFDRIRPYLYQHGEIFIIIYSRVSRESFDNIENRWIDDIQRVIPHPTLILVGSKSDLTDDPQVIERLRKRNQTFITHEEGDALRHRIRAAIHLTCTFTEPEAASGILLEAVRAHAARPPEKKVSRSCVIL